MAIVYQQEKAPGVQEVAELYRSAGLRRPVDDLDRIGRMIAGANLIITARDGGRLVGIARSLSDNSYCCYLSDLAVHKDYQRAGIGKELIRQVQQAIGEETMLLLLAAPNAMEYYPHVGFDKVDNAWMIQRIR